MSESTLLANRVGIVALDDTDYGERSSEVTRVSTRALADAVELLDTLGYQEADVRAVEACKDKDETNPMLNLEPTDESLFAENTAAVSIAPRTPEDDES